MTRVTMRTKEAAEYLDISYWKLLELAKAGKIPHIRIDGRLLFRKESLDGWLQMQEDESLHKPEPVAKIRRL